MHIPMERQYEFQMDIGQFGCKFFGGSGYLEYAQ
jgi:hypothetical protein